MKTAENSSVTRTVPHQATIDTVGAFRAPRIDQATVDFYLRRGRVARARAFADLIRALFSLPASRDEDEADAAGARPVAEVHALPARRQAGPAADDPSMHVPSRGSRAA